MEDECRGRKIDLTDYCPPMAGDCNLVELLEKAVHDRDRQMDRFICLLQKSEERIDTTNAMVNKLVYVIDRMEEKTCKVIDTAEARTKKLLNFADKMTDLVSAARLEALEDKKRYDDLLCIINKIFDRSVNNNNTISFGNISGRN